MSPVEFLPVSQLISTEIVLPGWVGVQQEGELAVLTYSLIIVGKDHSSVVELILGRHKVPYSTPGMCSLSLGEQ